MEKSVKPFSKKNYKRSVSILSHQRNAIKFILRFHFHCIPVRMAIIQKTTTNAAEPVGKEKSLCIAGENVSLCCFCGNQYGNSEAGE